MKNSGMFRKVAAMSMAVVFALALAGCSSGMTGAVAATVNGQDIQEDTITKYIQDFRTSADLTTDEAWGEWMKENDYTPETVREFVIDYYVEKALVEQAAKDKEISVSDEEVQQQVDSMKANYENDEQWNEALETAGITEDEYRESIHDGLLTQRLQENVAADAAASDEEVLEMYNMYSSMFNNSKRSSHILFETGDEATANDVLNQINSGQISFADAAKQYSKDPGSAENGGDVGWNTLNSFVTEYTEAVEGLEKGQVSGLVNSDFGIHIITVTDVFTPEENTTDLSKVPTEFVEYIRSIVTNQNQSTKYQEWYTSYKEEADITINPMPEDVPYNIPENYYKADDGAEGEDAAVEGADEDGVITLTEEDLAAMEGGEGEDTDGAEGGEGSASAENGEGDAAADSNDAQPSEEPTEQPPAEEGE